MTDAADTAPTKETKFPAIGMLPNFGFLLEANQQSFARWFQGTMELSKDITQFTQNRLQEDMAAWSALSQCKSIDEAVECQRRLVEKATAQYSEEIAKLSQIMMNLASEGLTSFAKGHAKAP